jgi:hypothetical protein
MPNRDQTRRLPFAAPPDIELPPEVRQQCHALLVELLSHIVRAERMRRSADEREDPINASR